MFCESLVEQKKFRMGLLNSLSSDKILDWSKLKSSADHGINVTINLKFVCEGWKTLWENEVLFKNCSQNLIPSKTLVAMATKWNFLANSLKIFSSETASRILKLFHRDVPWVTLFKKCL